MNVIRQTLRLTGQHTTLDRVISALPLLVQAAGVIRMRAVVRDFEITWSELDQLLRHMSYGSICGNV
ncbi:hypothetical protein INT43_007237 [Umbelopsis isabellina]|uniref:Uncharacterized protein n=1 Tax=Mortierella isabellina TaxID=91625 RepID=A0A8H7PZ05_MORIS|nr:hypothetical protein INT43_007237 [Umbelopsis isabellina]